MITFIVCYFILRPIYWKTHKLNKFVNIFLYQSTNLYFCIMYILIRGHRW